jgi:hypothetical protein
MLLCNRDVGGVGRASEKVSRARHATNRTWRSGTSGFAVRPVELTVDIGSLRLLTGGGTSGGLGLRISSPAK